jgi:hypothetical protein
MLLVMDNKEWLVEVVMVVCLITAGIVAFFVSGGYSLWQSMTHK